jgi:Archaeal/vacuolar-type H+-ATPase subunit E
LSNDAKLKIVEEAKRKADELIKEAEKTAEAIIRDAEEKWRVKAEAERNRILREARMQASAIIAEARKTSSFIIGKAKAEIIENVYEKAYEIIREGKYDVESSLRNLLKEALNYVEEPLKVIVREDQIDLAKRILRELGYNGVEVEGSNDIIGGVILVSREGIIVDNRVETRLKQSRDRLLNIIARVLLGDS